jgi:hypothetical protein
MDALQFFLMRHRQLHGKRAEELLEGMTDEQLRLRPRDDVNSVAWLIWHMARCEDVGLNRLVVDRPQVLDQEDWPTRLGVSLRQYGTGMTDDEVGDFSAQIDLGALLAYWAAVGRRTVEVVESLCPEDLDTVPDTSQVRRVLYDEGVLGPNAAWVEEMYLGQTRGYFLAHLGLTHNYAHSGEAFLVRGLLGLRAR